MKRFALLLLMPLLAAPTPPKTPEEKALKRIEQMQNAQRAAQGDVLSQATADGLYQPLATDLTRLVANCNLDNDSTPIPDSCVGDGTDGGGGGAAWGDITGTLSDQTDLDAALDALAADIAEYTAADVLAKLLTVDGAGSSLDADLLDGSSSAAFQSADSDLTSIAALTTTAHGRGLLDDADATASRASIGAVIGADVQAFATDLQRLVDNCVVENDSTPIPDTCVGDGSDSGGAGGPTILGADVNCAVNASYCAIFTISGGSISASRGVNIEGVILIDTNSTTVAAQFRVSSADTGYTGNCRWDLPESTTATTTPASDIVAIGSGPADTAGTTWFSTAPVPAYFSCALLSDASPGDIVIEWQLETGTATQTALRGSYYTLIQ